MMLMMYAKNVLPMILETGKEFRYGDISGLKKQDQYWGGGKILDPLNGKVYKCKVWVENGDLLLRGYIGFAVIGRMAKWLPLN